MLKQLLALYAVFALLAPAASKAGAQAIPSRSPNHPAQARHWVETRLYFGLGPVNAPDQAASEAAWQRFLDSEVTPRFSSGLSVADLYGQWKRDPGAPLQRLRSKVLILDYPRTTANTARVEAIRSAWKRRTGDISVLRVTQPVDLSV